MIGVFIVIAVIFDLSENLDDFLKSRAPWYKIITHYYLSFCLYFGTLLSAFIIFLTIIWFTSKLAQQSEAIAILSGGVSYLRFIRPYFIAASILVTVLLFMSHVIVPRANKIKYDFEVEFIKAPLTTEDVYVHREFEPGTIAYFYLYRPATTTGENFALENWNNGKLTKKIMGSHAKYDLKKKTWTIHNAQIRTFLNDSTEKLELRERIDTTLALDEEDFVLRSEFASSMTWTELNEFIEDQKLGGSGRVAQFEIEKYNRTASPFSIFVLTLIGVSIASRKQRGGIGLHLMLAVIIGFIFVFISRMTTVSAMTLGFPASVAVWIPNIIFTLVGIYLYRKAQK